VLAGAIPRLGASRLDQLSHVFFDHWPREWSNRYFSSNYIFSDPTVDLVVWGSAPFLWSEVSDLSSLRPRGRRIMDEAAEFRLCEGLTIAFTSIENRPIGFSVAGERINLDPRGRITFHLVAAYALGCAVVLAGGKRKLSLTHLTSRQRDVLHWAAEGLNLDAIAERLSISSNTAETHLRAVRSKLGVANTVHAVAEAFRLGLIS